MGLLFYAFSFLALPYVLIFPHKFGALNSIGSISLIVSIIQFKGLSVIKAFFSRNYWVYLFGLVFGIFLELYYSTLQKDLVLMICGFGIQTVCTLYLLMTFVPNGVAMLD